MIRKILCLISVSPVWAQGFSGGLHVNGLIAVGDLKTDEAGGTRKALSANLGGGHVAYALNERDELALTLNAAAWNGNSISPIPGLSATNDYTFLQLGLDWRHRLQGAQGLGLVGGLNLTRVKRNFTVAPSVVLGSFGSTNVYTQSGRPGLKVGAFIHPVGWFSLEGTLNHVLMEKKANTADRLDSASWLQVRSS